MAEETIDIEIKGISNAKKELRDAVNNARDLALAFGATSKQATEAAEKAAALKDELDDANDAITSFKGGGAFTAVTKGLGSVAGGFTAIQGAVALAGGESKNFEKTMIKLQGALALTQGLEALEDLPRAFKQIGTVGTKAFNSIKVAIGSTGIGLLVIALGVIVAYWEDIVGLVSGVSAEQKTLNAETAKNLELNEANLAAVEGSEEILKLQGKSEEEIYQIKLKQYDATIETAKASLTNAKITKDAQVEAAQRNKTILQGIIRFLSLPLTTLLATVDMVGKALGQDFGLEEKFSGGLASLVFDPKETAKEGDATIKEAEDKLRELENKRAGLINASNAKKQSERDAENAKAKASAEKSAEEAKQIAEKNAKDASDLDKQIGLDKEKRLAEGFEKERIAIDQSYRDRIAKAKELFGENSAQEKELIAQRDAEILAAQIAFDKKLEDQAKSAAAETKANTDKAYADLQAATDELYKAKQKAIIESGKTEEQIADDLAAAEVQNLQDRIADAKLFGEEYNAEVIDLELELAGKLKEIRDKTAQDEKDKRDQKLEDAKEIALGVLDTANAVADAVQAKNDADMAEELKAAGEDQEKRAAIEKKYFEKNKKVQIAQAIIQTLQGAIGAFTSLAVVPVVGPVLGAIAAAAALAAGYSNVRKIQATEFQGGGDGGGSQSSMYAEGGLLIGPTHDQGGIRTSMGELEGGEFVMNRRSTQNFLPLLEAINAQGNTPGPGQTDLQATTPIFKTYVVATDVTSQQEINAKLSALARL